MRPTPTSTRSPPPHPYQSNAGSTLHRSGMPELNPTRLEPTAPAETDARPTVATPFAGASPANLEPPRRGFLPNFHRNEMWTYFGPAFVASVAYIDPGNFA